MLVAHRSQIFRMVRPTAFQRTQAFVGLELVLDTHRLLLMNLMLHGIEATGVALGDTLSPDGERLPKADLILTNPPFGTKKGGGRPTRSDFSHCRYIEQTAGICGACRPRDEARCTHGDGGTRQRPVRR